MGIVIDSNGVINVAASTPGTYRITYTTAGTCPSSSFQDVTINALDNAAFSYSASSYTTADADPTPTITGLTGGTFSGTTGLVINSTTGEIDLSASTVASHTVTYNTTSSGSSVCPNTSTFSLAVTAAGIANNYSMNFDGVNDYIQTNNTFSALDGLQKMTLSLWIKPTNPNTSRHIISIPHTVGFNKNVIRLTIRNTNLLWFTVDTDSFRAIETTQTLVFNQWNHIAVVVDTTQTQMVDRIKIYNNATFSKGADNMTLNKTFNTSIGGIFIGENASNLSYLSSFAGEMDEVAIWDTALTDGTGGTVNQIAEIYNATSTNSTKDLTTVSGSNLKYWNRMGD